MKERTITWRYYILLLVCLPLLACATMSEVIKSKNEGTAQVYSVSANTAWKIAITVLRWENSETIEEHRDENYMLTTTGQDFISAGTLIGVWIEPMDSTLTKVTVVTKRRVKTNIATGLTESTFQSRFAQAVDMVKSGKPLPIEKPYTN